MMGFSLSRRARLGLIAVFLLALIVLFPMRLAFGMLGIERYGVSARAVNGSIWSGKVAQLQLGEVPLGTVNAGLSPVPLLLLRAHLGIERSKGLPDDIKGALTAGPGRFGIDNVTGNVPMGSAAAPLPIAGIDLTDVTARFAQGRCANAKGQVHATMAGDIAGINLAQGFSGTARCDGDALLLPLVSQSGMEKINVRLQGSGRYSAEMRITPADPALAEKLSAAGFRQADGDSVFRIEGTM